MQPNKKEFENVLGIAGAKIVLERVGQQQMDNNDKVLVRGTIYLPTNGPGNGNLADNLRFGDRVKIFESRLSWNWGQYDEESGRMKESRTWQATTWKEAFEEIEKECFGEVQKLRNALDARQKALEDAEKE
jgi:septin family protein